MIVTFDKAGQDFDNQYKNKSKIQSLAQFAKSGYRNVKIRNKGGKPNEEYYRQRLIYCMIIAKKYNKDNLGLEIPIPEGRIRNKNAANVRTDITIFTSTNWPKYTHSFLRYHNQDDMQWIERHMLVNIECKCEPNNSLQQTIDRALPQLKSYVSASECPHGKYGIICDETNLYIFKKTPNNFKRLLGSKDTYQPDRNENLPTYDEFYKSNFKFKRLNYRELNKLTPRDTRRMKQILYDIKATMDNDNFSDSNKEFTLLVQIIAIKIYDERNNADTPDKLTDLFITSKERVANFNDQATTDFTKRFAKILTGAKNTFPKIINLSNKQLHMPYIVDIIKEIINMIQDISFVGSAESNLYQLIFDEFSPNPDESIDAEFLTPLAVVKFLVALVHPRGNETLCDPTVGTADFLSVAFSQSKRNDENHLKPQEIYGLDIKPQIIKLAKLNMMLNDDGNSNIVYCPNKLGSIAYKFSNNPNKTFMPITNVEDQYNEQASKHEWKCNWNHVKDASNTMKKFNVILTNPPFGKQRPFNAKDSKEAKEVSKRYELFHKSNSSKIDKGILFLENMVKSLKPNGRYGIVLSSSIASVANFSQEREWLINHTRIVGIFDLPPKTFADTAVNTTIIIGYLPKDKTILDNDYQVFSRNIKHVGYTVKVSKRSTILQPNYIIDNNGYFKKDSHGNLIENEDFTQTLKDFNYWLKITDKSKDSALLQKYFGGVEE